VPGSGQDEEGDEQVGSGELGDVGDLLEQSDKELRLETLRNVFVIVVDAVLKSDLAGEDVTEMERVGDAGGNCACGTLTSLRTTIRERCNRFRTNRLETYSRADVS
jgi:hypothetical protein